MYSINIPDKIKIGAKYYTVIKDENLTDENELLGVCFYNQARIRIASELPESLLEETFIHEVLHACLYESGYVEQDEEMVRRLAKTLHSVLHENGIQHGN